MVIDRMTFFANKCVKPKLNVWKNKNFHYLFTQLIFGKKRLHFIGLGEILLLNPLITVNEKIIRYPDSNDSLMHRFRKQSLDIFVKFFFAVVTSRIETKTIV